MQTIILHHIYYDFWNSFENSKKISPKTNFLGFFRKVLGHALPRPECGAKNVFAKWKFSSKYTIVPSFVFIEFVVVKLYIFKVSHTSKKGDFGLLLGGFSCITTPNQVRFPQNLHRWSSARQSITYGTGFDLLLKIRVTGPKKPIFGVFFRGFWATPSDSLSTTPKYFVKWKVSWRYTTVPNFIFIAFVVLKL